METGNTKWLQRHKIEDEVGHYVFVGENAGIYKVIQPGVNGELLETTLQWKSAWVYHNYQATNAPNANYSFINDELYQSLYVLDKITLPTQAGGLEYTFTYHAANSAPPTGNYTPGWGQLESVTLPSGARADYSYSIYGNDPSWESFTVIGSTVLGRVLTYQSEYDGQTQQVTETTSYGAGNGVGSACSPDGRCQTQVSAVGGYLAGYAYRISQTGGSVTEKIWVTKRPMGGSVYALIEPFVKTEFTTVPDTSGNPVLTATKDFDYDQNGNVLEVREYDWVPYSSVPRSSIGEVIEYLPLPRVTGLPSGLTLKRRTVNTYYYPTPNRLDPGPNSPNHYSNPASPKFKNLIKSTEIKDSNGATVSRTEFYYDGGMTSPDKGNLTETRAWDSTKGVYSNPLTTANSISTTVQYDQYGNPVLTTDAKGVQTQIVYGDIVGPNGTVNGLYPTQIVAAYGTPLARTSTAVYDFYTGLVTSATDVDNGVTSATEYDSLGRSLKSIAAAGTPLEVWTRTEYDDLNRRIIVRSDLETKGDGKKVAVQHYDQLGRVRLSRSIENIVTEDPSNETHGIKVQIRYQTGNPNSYQLTSNPFRAATALAATNEPTMGWTRSMSVNTGRHAETESFSGASLPAPWGSNTTSTGKIQTDTDANATTVTDQAGKLRRSITNGLGQLTRVDEPDSSGQLGTVASPNQPTYYTYDTLNNLMTVSQGAQTRTFTYNSLSRLLSASNPESGTISYGYDPNGNLTGKIDARNITTTYTYDALNRVTLRDYSDTTPDVTYTYDNLPNAKGKLTKVVSSVSTTEYTAFDILGRVTGHKQTTDGTDYSTGYVYNLSGALIEQIYPSGRVVKNVLDNEGDLALVQSKKNSTHGYWTYANSFAYNAAGAVTSMQLGNGKWESTIFNSRLQPTQIALGTVQNGSDKLKLEYGYGTTANNGNVLSQKITVKRPNQSDLVFDQTYTYDSLNRITSAEEKTGTTVNWNQTYIFDRYGNRNFNESLTTTIAKNCVEGGNPAVCEADREVFNPTLNTANNRMATGQGYTYDATGNVIIDAEGRIFTYDAENKQIEAKNASQAVIGTYLFDGDGKRIKKVVPGTGETTIFVYDAGGKLVAEYSTIVETVETAKVQYLTADNLGTPRINTDRDGNVTSRSDYMPYGEEIVGLGNRSSTDKYVADDVRQGFTGYENDDETGFDFAQARMYSNGLGRFTGSDPLQASASSSRPQSWNRYSYSYNNPLRFTDPSGMIVGDYYDLEGKWLGSDDKDDKRAYIIYDNEKNKKLGERAAIVIEDAAQVVPAIAQSVVDSNKPSGDDKKGKFHEEAVQAHTVDGKTTVTTSTGPYQPDPSKGTHVVQTIKASTTLISHVHPAGTKTEVIDDPSKKSGGGTTVYSTSPVTSRSEFVQKPSQQDIQNALPNGTNIAVGARDKTVYFYAATGNKVGPKECNCIAKMSLDNFKKIGRQR